jgi:hypothetical protein
MTTMLSKQNITDLQILVSRRNADLFEKRDQLNLKIAHLKDYSLLEYRKMLEQERSEVIDEIDNNNNLVTSLSLMKFDARLAENRAQLKGSDLIQNLPLSC